MTALLKLFKDGLDAFRLSQSRCQSFRQPSTPKIQEHPLRLSGLGEERYRGETFPQLTTQCAPQRQALGATVDSSLQRATQATQRDSNGGMIRKPDRCSYQPPVQRERRKESVPLVRKRALEDTDQRSVTSTFIPGFFQTDTELTSDTNGEYYFCSESTLHFMFVSSLL